jgi:hypothetical protein
MGDNISYSRETRSEAIPRVSVHFRAASEGLFAMGEISCRIVEGIRMLDLSGAHVLLEDATQIEVALVEAAATKPRGVVVNYGPVTEMTSGNYGVFLLTVVAAFKCTKQAQLPVKLIIPDNFAVQSWTEHLRITHLDHLVEIYSSEEEAIASFADQ